MTQYQFSGKSDGKGRNGYFKIATSEYLIARYPTLPTVVHVDVFSQRKSGNCGPLRMQLTPDDVKTMREMFNDIVKELEEGKEV